MHGQMLLHVGIDKCVEHIGSTLGIGILVGDRNKASLGQEPQVHRFFQVAHCGAKDLVGIFRSTRDMKPGDPAGTAR